MFTDLPADVVDRVLTFLPSYNTLSAVLQTSKRHIYTVFQTHPKSITLAIAYNVVGPALPQALRLLVLKKLLDEKGEFPEETLPNEDQAMEIPLTRDFAELLESHAQAIWTLEDLFSFRYKDRSLSKSRLSTVESLKFHRAMYRFWAATRFQYENAYDEEDEDEDDDDRKSDVIVKFLKVLRTPELHELDRVASFLQEVVGWSQCAAGFKSHAYTQSIAISAGPDIVLKAFETCTVEELRGYYETSDANTLFADAMQQLWVTRNVNVKARQEHCEEAILDNNGSLDKCHCCLAGGVHLWGSTNWQLFHYFHTPIDLCRLLGGLLWRNGYETSPIVQQMMDTDSNKKRTFSFPQLLDEMFDLENDPDGIWDKKRLYCDTCILGLFRQRFRKWRLASKLKEGVAIGEDCWYGYNCRTQAHKWEHAQKLNHLCEPTRGDVPPAI